MYGATEALPENTTTYPNKCLIISLLDTLPPLFSRFYDTELIGLTRANANVQKK